MTVCRCGCGERVRPGATWRTGHNMRVQPKAGRLRAGKRLWTKAEHAELRRTFPHQPTAKVARQLNRTYSAVCQRAKILGLQKTKAYLASPEACRLRRGDNVGAPFRFSKGHVPANKGLRRPGWAVGRMRETQFKKGERRGVAVKLWKPIGSERISKDGYLERKTHDAIPDGISRQEANRLRQRRWRAVHLIVWEAAHGPLPKGHAVAFTNHNKTDIRLENLECITRRELMLRNTVHNLPKPLAQTVQLLGALNRQIRRRMKDAEEQDGRPPRSPVRNPRGAQGRRQADGSRSR